MGNRCCGYGVSKEHVEYELTALLCNAIAEESECYTSDFVVSYQRLCAAKKQMEMVRTRAKEWPKLLQMGANVTEPCHVSVCDIAECMNNCLRNVFKLGHLITLCTYVTDVCVLKLCKNDPVDVYTAVVNLVKILVAKNFDTCVKFLNYIDSLPFEM